MPQAWLPRQTRKVHPRWYGWDVESGLFGMRSPGSDTLGDFLPSKFLVAVNNVSFGHPSGGALLRSLAWYWCAANFSADWLLNFAQIFGQPIRWATYDKSDPELKDIMESMLENMGAAAWAAAPTGSTLELKEPSNKGSDNPQNQMIDMADTACDLLILGQTLTSSPGEAGSRALGEVHYNVRSDIIDAAADWVAEVMNEQLLTAVFDFNGPAGNEDSSLPYFAPTSKEVKDRNAAVDRIGKILDKGIPLSKSYVYETIDLGDIIGVSRQTVTNIESGKSEMKWTTFLAIMFVFSLDHSSVEYLRRLDIPYAEIKQWLAEKRGEK